MKRFLSIAIASALCTPVFAQTAGSSSDFTYRRGETIEESVLPATPQAASVSGYFSSAFSYSTGSAQIDIPIYTLAGHELSIPIGLRYSGGSGIKLDEVGLVTDEMKERQKIAEKDIDCIDFGARLYSPVIRRWATPDPKSEDWYGISPYSYCAGDPVNFVDPDGNGIIWDGLNVAWDISEIVSDIKAGDTRGAILNGVATAVDVFAMIVPGVPAGAGRAMDVIGIANKAANAGETLSSLEKAGEFGVDTYKNLKKAVVAEYGTNSGYEVHHLVEKRFAKNLGITESEIPSIVLTKEEHRVFTNEWRKEIPYGSDYSDFNIDDIKSMYAKIYSDYPDIIRVLDKFFDSLKQ